MRVPKAITRVLISLASRSEFIFNVHEPVVLGYSLASSGRAGLEMSGSHTYRQVGNEVVDRFARAV